MELMAEYRQDVEDIFRPVVNRILELVQQQVEKIHIKGKTVVVSFI